MDTSVESGKALPFICCACLTSIAPMAIIGYEKPLSFTTKYFRKKKQEKDSNIGFDISVSYVFNVYMS